MRPASCWREMKRKVYRLIVILFVALALTVNVRLHRPGDVRVVLAQLEYLEQALSEGAGEKMQSYFPEGYVFTWTLYGLASAQVARQLRPGDLRRAHYLAEAWRAVEMVRSAEARSTFQSEMDPPWGAFYSSWSLYVLAEYVRAAGPDRVRDGVLELFRREGDSFIAWSRSSMAPAAEVGDQWVRLVPRAWYVPLHLLSILLCGVVFLRARYLLRAMNANIGGGA